ncbi:MAG: arsenate reductase ArsC [Candidatus Thermoplasmatota archaeon]
MKVLFVCVGNSARSQMAEAIARHHGLVTASSGTEPAGRVHPLALQVLGERGISTAGLRPKLLDWTTLASFDRTITMGCGVAESCPSLRTDEDWELDDPASMGLAEFRAMADEIERRVVLLKKSA